MQSTMCSPHCMQAHNIAMLSARAAGRTRPAAFRSPCRLLGCEHLLARPAMGCCAQADAHLHLQCGRRGAGGRRAGPGVAKEGLGISSERLEHACPHSHCCSAGHQGLQCSLPAGGGQHLQHAWVVVNVAVSPDHLQSAVHERAIDLQVMQGLATAVQRNVGTCPSAWHPLTAATLCARLKNMLDLAPRPCCLQPTVRLWPGKRCRRQKQD